MKRNNTKCSWIILDVFKHRLCDPWKLGFWAWWCMLIEVEQAVLKIIIFILLKHVTVCWIGMMSLVRVLFHVFTCENKGDWNTLDVSSGTYIPSLGKIINPNFEIFASMTLITDIIVHEDDKKIIFIPSQQEILLISALYEHGKGNML